MIQKSQSALHLAAESGSIEAVKVLLKAGVDVNLQSQNKSTVLFTAVKNNKPTLVDELILSGANVNHLNEV